MLSAAGVYAMYPSSDPAQTVEEVGILLNIKSSEIIFQCFAVVIDCLSDLGRKLKPHRILLGWQMSWQWLLLKYLVVTQLWFGFLLAGEKYQKSFCGSQSCILTVLCNVVSEIQVVT